MLKIAITGGIGSGKTTVANLFTDLGVPVIDADKIAHDITQPQSTAFTKIVANFGKTILKPNGTLDRHKIREIVFHDAQEKQWLERLLHPIILKTMQTEIQRINAPYCILVIPLLLETKQVDVVDRVLVVDAPQALQMQRTQQRSPVDEKTIRAIMQVQCSRTERLAMADDIIVNDGAMTALQDTVNALHAKYLELAG